MCVVWITLFQRCLKLSNMSLCTRLNPLLQRPLLLLWNHPQGSCPRSPRPGGPPSPPPPRPRPSRHGAIRAQAHIRCAIVPVRPRRVGHWPWAEMRSVQATVGLVVAQAKSPIKCRCTSKPKSQILSGSKNTILDPLYILH